METPDTIKPHPKRKLRLVLLLLGRIFLTAGVLMGGVYLWALLSTANNLIARGIVWGDSDVDDWKRFPSRTFRASPDPVIFATGEALPWDEVVVEDTYPMGEYLQRTDTTAFLILHGDKIIYEGYFNGGSRESTETSFSVAKSFVSTLVGIALAEGYIGNLDDSITNYLPELTERDPRFADITLRHLITMSSGLRWERTAAAIDDSFISYYAPDLRAATMDVPIVEPPGSQFVYNDYNPLLIGMVLERATGVPVSAYMETRLWQPMGAEGDGSWSLDSERSGFEKMFVGVNGRAIDMAKLGWLFLNGGRNGDQQVVPTAWVEEAVQDITDSERGYGYYWWIDEGHGAYWAEGDKCQYIYVYPRADLVLMRNGRGCGEGPYFGPGFLASLSEWLETKFAE